MGLSLELIIKAILISTSQQIAFAKTALSIKRFEDKFDSENS